MALSFALNSTTKGDIFTSTREDFRSGKVPKTPFPLTRSHSRFADLWRSHLAELVDLACYTPVISALGALAAGVTSSGSQHDTEIKDLLRSHPPNLIILRDAEVEKGKPKYYGIHVRKDGLWPFICLHEHYVNAFLAAKEGSDEELALMSIIKTSIDHVLGHWIFTLRVGFNANGSHPTSNLNEAPSSDLTPNVDNETPKMTGATWKRSSKGGIGEAGDFVENRSRGGIMELKPDGIAYLVTATGDIALPSSYLSVYRRNGTRTSNRATLGYVPPHTHGAKRRKLQDETVFFPTSGDTCPSTPPLKRPRSSGPLGDDEKRGQFELYKNKVFQRRAPGEVCQKTRTIQPGM